VGETIEEFCTLDCQVGAPWWLGLRRAATSVTHFGFLHFSETEAGKRMGGLGVQGFFCKFWNIDAIIELFCG